MDSGSTKEQKSRRIWEIEVEIAKLKKEQDNLKNQIQNSLVTSEGAFESYKDEFWEVHHKLGSVTTKFDENAFLKNEPEEYKKFFSRYSKTNVGKDSWNWTKQNKLV